MRRLIKKVLTEEVGIMLEMKINRKSLLHDLQVMDYDYDDAVEILNHHIEWIESLPNELKLYRIIYIDDESEINMKQPGKHYSIDYENLMMYHEFVTGYGEKKFLITVLANKSMIDVQDTISNNILYPNEMEITLKQNGRGAKIIKIEELT